MFIYIKYCKFKNNACISGVFLLYCIQVIRMRLSKGNYMQNYGNIIAEMFCGKPSWEKVMKGLLSCEVKVNSSNVSSFLWSGETNDLVVTFNNGSKYRYKEFDEDAVIAFISSTSKGSHFYTNIKTSYEFDRLV